MATEYESEFSELADAIADAFRVAREQAAATNEPCPVTLHGAGTPVGRTIKFMVYSDGKVTQDGTSN